MTKDKALDLALEALENGKRVRNAEGGTKYQPDLEDNAITAIKQARALDKKAKNARELGLDHEPVQEPVAHCEAGPRHCQQCHLEDRSLALAAAVRYVQNNTPKLVSDEICMALTTPPAQPAPVQELQRYSPNGEGGMEVDSLGAYVKHQDVTTQPAAQRQLVGLTAEERAEIAGFAAISDWHDFEVIGAVEAKLKEKNNG
jgi:hypothetical protein